MQPAPGLTRPFEVREDELEVARAEERSGRVEEDYQTPRRQKTLSFRSPSDNPDARELNAYMERQPSTRFEAEQDERPTAEKASPEDAAALVATATVSTGSGQPQPQPEKQTTLSEAVQKERKGGVACVAVVQRPVSVAGTPSAEQQQRVPVTQDEFTGRLLSLLEREQEQRAAPREARSDNQRMVRVEAKVSFPKGDDNAIKNLDKFYDEFNRVACLAMGGSEPSAQQKCIMLVSCWPEVNLPGKKMRTMQRSSGA